MIVEPKVAGEREREGSMKECLLLLLVDSARLFITPWTPASVSYITAKPSLTDGHEWGEKNGCKILQDVLGENKGGAVMDGCVWPMQGGRQRWVSSRWDRESAEPVPLCPEQPSLVRMRGISLSCLRQCFYHSCQNRRSPYSTAKSGPHVMGIQEHSETVHWVCDRPDVSKRADTSPKQHHGGIRQLRGDFMPHMVLHRQQQNNQ